LIIRNYGLHWKREAVNWGKKGVGNAGSLTGRLATKAKSKHVDFRDQAGVYILQDRFRVVYIGQAGRGAQRLFSRLKSHTKNHLADRWNRFSWFGIYPVKGDLVDSNLDLKKIKTDAFTVLDHLEGALISITEPPLNRQGPHFGDVGQYIQRRPENDTDDDNDDEEGME